MAGNKSYDAVHKPSHYTEGRNYEPKDVIRDWGLNFNLGSAVKYVARAGRKDDVVQDLKKAQEFIQFEIDAIEAERKKVPVKPNNKIDVDKKPLKMHEGIMIRVAVPVGMDPEIAIQQFINQIYGGN